MPVDTTARTASTTWRSAGLALGTASALGFARFAYGLFVPAMTERLHWTLTEAGILSTANSCGYLLGALVSATVIGRTSLATTFRAGMVLTVASLAATAMTGSYPVLLAARAAAGLSGALTFISGAALATRLARIRGSVTPMTVYFAGAGVGVALSGGLIPPLLDHHPDRWMLGWWLLSTAAALATAGGWPAAGTPEPGGEAPVRGAGRPSRLWRVAAAYLLFGAGYIGYVTFLSAYLAGRRTGTTTVSLTWILIGLSAVAAPALWNRPIANWGGPRALRVLLGVIGCAAVLPLLGSWPSFAASALLFGSAFMMVPAAVTAIVARSRPADVNRTLAGLTVVFAAGQSVGPWLAGIVADHADTAAALALTTALCAVAAILAGGRAPSPSTAPAAAPPALTTVDGWVGVTCCSSSLPACRGSACRRGRPERSRGTG